MKVNNFLLSLILVSIVFTKSFYSQTNEGNAWLNDLVNFYLSKQFASYYEKDNLSGNLRLKGERYDEKINNAWRNVDSLRYEYHPDYGKYSSIHKYSYDTLNASWYEEGKIIFTYNTLGQVITVEMLFWNDSVFENYEKWEYFYDMSGNLVEKVEYVGINVNQWVQNHREIYVINSNNLVDTKVEYAWSTTTNSWNSFWKTEYTYYPNGEIKKVLDKKWVGTEWENFTLHIENRDISTNKLYSIYRYSYDVSTDSWKNSMLDSIVYNSIADEVITHYNNWNSTTNSWMFISRDLIFKNSQDLCYKKTIQIFNIPLSEWKNLYEYDYQYDSNNNLTQELKKNWVETDWMPDYSLDYNYNSENYKTYKIYRVWDITINGWKDINRHYFWYEENPLIIDNETQEHVLSIYPNPSAGENVFIEFKVNTFNEPLKLTIYSLNGNMIYSNSINVDNQNCTYKLDVSSWSRGLYLIEIKNSIISITKQLIIN